jgi:protein SDA1
MNFGSVMHPHMRQKLFQALIHLRNKGSIQPTQLISLSFKLFSIQDKILRQMLTHYIVNDLKSLNASGASLRYDDGSFHSTADVKKSVQSLLFSIITSDDSFSALKTVEILSDLYRQRIWTDERTVNILALACNQSDSKVTMLAMNFFLGIENKMSEDENAMKVAKNLDINYHEHSKKTKKRSRQVQRQTQKQDKLKREAMKYDTSTPLFPAIALIQNPYDLAENVSTKAKSQSNYEVKLLCMNFISRLIGCHKLQLLSYYSFMQRYLLSNQKDISQILAYTIQSIHDFIPPQELVPVVKSIANNFINERCTDEAIVVGINSIREIITRLPSILYEETVEVLVQDVAMYSRKMHKEVIYAAKRFIVLIRLAVNLMFVN